MHSFFLWLAVSFFVLTPIVLFTSAGCHFSIWSPFVNRHFDCAYRFVLLMFVLGTSSFSRRIVLNQLQSLIYGTSIRHFPSIVGPYHYISCAVSPPTREWFYYLASFHDRHPLDVFRHGFLWVVGNTIYGTTKLNSFCSFIWFPCFRNFSHALGDMPSAICRSASRLPSAIRRSASWCRPRRFPARRLKEMDKKMWITFWAYFRR